MGKKNIYIIAKQSKTSRLIENKRTQTRLAYLVDNYYNITTIISTKSSPWINDRLGAYRILNTYIIPGIRVD